MTTDSIFSLIEQERIRQTLGIELIASENYVSNAVLGAMGLSVIEQVAKNNTL